MKNKNKNKKKDQTTFDVNKHNSVQYKINDKLSTIVIFDARHKIGHKTVLALASKGLNVNDFVDDSGNPKRALLKAIREAATSLKVANKTKKNKK